MKKLFLTLMCLLAVGITAKAESVTITQATEGLTLSGSGYGEFKYEFDGITIQGWAQKNNGIALQASGGYIAVTQNSNAYLIENVVIKVTTTSGKTTTLTGKVQSEAYSYTATKNTDWVGQNAGANNLTQNKEVTFTYNINDKAFVLYNSVAGGQIIVKEITINYLTKHLPKMHFENQVIYGKVNTGAVWQQVVVDEPTTNAGAVTYSSSNPDIVEVDAATGRILPENVKAIGSAVITATMAETDDYAEGSASYKIFVKHPSAESNPGQTTFDFTVENPYGMTTQSGKSGKYEGDFPNGVKEIGGEKETVKLSFTGNYRSWKGTGYVLRLQKNSTLTIEVPDGYVITKIGMTGTSNGGESFTPASENVSEDDKTNYGYIWTSGANGGKQSVTFNAGKDDKQDIYKINVMWDVAGSNLDPAQLTFTPNVNGIIVGEKWTINAVNNPNNREITYSIPALDKADYSITPTNDGKLEVLVSQPGSYTLQATSPMGDGFRDGFAIMRLNVFRHINVYHEDVLVEQENIKANASKSTYVTFDVPENAFVYYKLETAANANVATQADEAEDENLEPGFTQYEDGVEIPANHNGALHFYIANYGYKSPVRKLNVSVATGVSEVEAAAEGEVKYYDLSGREVKGQPEQGIYIRLQGGKAEKVLVK